MRQSWNETVKLAMDSLDELAEVCRVQLNSDYNFTDTASKRYRYQAVFRRDALLRFDMSDASKVTVGKPRRCDFSALRWALSYPQIQRQN